MLRLTLLRIHRQRKWDGLDTQNKNSWPEDFKKSNYDGVLSVDGSIKLREIDAKIWTG
jgi:hypothetical protein